MTSSVERVVERKYRLQCSCGAVVETSEKQAICASCGQTFEIRRIKRIKRHTHPGRLRTRRHTASRIVPEDVLQLVEKPAAYLALYLLLLYDLYDLLHC